jgi:hypothetical protein
MNTQKQDRMQGNQGGKGEVSDGSRSGGKDQMQQGGKKPGQQNQQGQKPGQADGKQTDQPQHGGAGQHSTR